LPDALNDFQAPKYRCTWVGYEYDQTVAKKRKGHGYIYIYTRPYKE